MERQWETQYFLNARNVIEHWVTSQTQIRLQSDISTAKHFYHRPVEALNNL